MVLDALIVLACLAVIWVVSDRMVEALSSLAKDFQIPQSVAGATLAALGSSAPELATNALALTMAGTENAAGQADIGYATVFGSAILSLCLIIGVPAMFRPLQVSRRAITRDGAFYLLACAMTAWFIADRQVQAWEATALVVSYGLYLGVLLRDVWLHPEATESAGDYTPGGAAVTFLVCLSILGVVCYFLVGSTVGLATSLGLPTALISVFALAFGTALPDLITSIQAARQGNTSLALSNAIGSNCFDLLVALGLPTLVYTLLTGGALTLGGGAAVGPTVPAQLSGDLLLVASVYLLLVLAIALLILLDRPSLERTHGAALIALYPLFVLVVAGMWSHRTAVLGTDAPTWRTPLTLGVVGGLAGVAALLAMLAVSRWLLSRGGAALAVARHVIEEALRARTALVPMALLLLLLPIAPLLLDADQPLQYRVQTCLSYAMMLTVALLSLMTVLLSTSTLSGEIFGRQIYTVMVKPVRRGTYLFGRWLGLMWLNAILLTLVGLVVTLLVTYLAALPARTDADAYAVENEVLVARQTEVASLPTDLEQQVEAKIRGLIQRQATAALTGAEQGMLERLGGIEGARAQYRKELASSWFSLRPRNSKVFTFSGLEGARSAPSIQLLLKVLSSANTSEVVLTAELDYNGQRKIQRITLALDNVQTIRLANPDGALIRDDGTLRLRLYNADPKKAVDAEPPPAVHFSRMEVLYPVGSFTGNLVRSLLIVWIKLGFLAALGLMTASYMTFPVACLTCLVALFVVSTSGYLVDAARFYSLDQREVEAAKGVASFVDVLARGTSMYGKFSPADDLVDGRNVSWTLVAACALWIGVVWTGVTGLLAYLIFRVRELARVLV